MMTRRSSLVYLVLICIGIVVLAWQVAEHSRYRQSAKAALINRSRDITTTLELVIRSQRRFGGMVSQERMESVLNELVKSGELNSVALLNAAGEVVASAGKPIDMDARTMMHTVERWDRDTVTVVNQVDLGTNTVPQGEPGRPTIILPRRDPGDGPRTNSPPRDPFFSQMSTNAPERIERTERGERGERPPDDSFRPPGRSGRSFRMNEEEYKSLVERRGLHGLIIAMSTDTFTRAVGYDLWMRWLIGALAVVAVAGFGLAWRNVAKTSELQIRLVRASELNTHLKELNLAAAGLAHETRNPLNIIRGLAQLISKQQDAAPDVRKKSRDIVDETDRVTAQLNEFINYSRPREVRRAPVALGTLVEEVVRALNYDIEEKSISVQVSADPITIEADEQLLRQALFNLLLNAVQAVEPGGAIQVRAQKLNGAGAVLEIADNGPGVAPEHRPEIFKPYFTTHQNGTGLGLSVVQQIVHAHGWEIECRRNEPRGAVFRITHLKVAAA